MEESNRYECAIITTTIILHNPYITTHLNAYLLIEAASRASLGGAVNKVRVTPVEFAIFSHGHGHQLQLLQSRGLH